MPNVGLFSAADPLSEYAQVSIRYTVEVEGLPVYTELYDVDKLKEELAENGELAGELWMRRLKAPVECRDHSGFSASLTEYLADGTCSPHGDSRNQGGTEERGKKGGKRKKKAV